MRDSDSQWVILSGGERVRSERFILTGGEGVILSYGSYYQEVRESESQWVILSGDEEV